MAPAPWWSRSIAALGRARAPGAPGAEVLLLVPGRRGGDRARAPPNRCYASCRPGLPGCTFAVGRSRIAEEPSDLPRAANEALLAANVAEGGGDSIPPTPHWHSSRPAPTGCCSPR